MKSTRTAPHDVVINLQGDIPFLAPQVVSATAQLLADQPSCDISTVMVAEADLSETDQSGHSRRSWPPCSRTAAAPGRSISPARCSMATRRSGCTMGVYGYRREALLAFTAAPPSPLEKRERLEQLRALELGMSIWAAVIDEAPDLRG